MALAQMTWRSAFSVGNAPALTGNDDLQKFTNAFTLFTYIQATMPRPFPATLSEEEYWAITAFLLDINGINLQQNQLGQENSLTYLLSN